MSSQAATKQYQVRSFDLEHQELTKQSEFLSQEKTRLEALSAISEGAQGLVSNQSGQ